MLGEWFRLSFTENEGAAFGMKLGGEYGKTHSHLFSHPGRYCRKLFTCGKS
jgi:hypothetical protein